MVRAFAICTVCMILVACGNGNNGADFSVLGTAHGQEGNATLTWTNATQNTDGTALTDLAGTRFQWGKGTGGPYDVGQVEVPGTAAGAQMETNVVLPSPGSWCFIGIHYTTDGRTSAPSNEVCKVIKPRPNPPRIDSVT